MPTDDTKLRNHPVGPERGDSGHINQSAPAGAEPAPPPAVDHPIWKLCNRIDTVIREAIHQSRTNLTNANEIAAGTVWLTAEIRGHLRAEALAGRPAAPPAQQLIDVSRDVMRFLKACRYEFSSDFGEAASLFMRLDEAVSACKSGLAAVPPVPPPAQAQQLADALARAAYWKTSRENLEKYAEDTLDDHNHLQRRVEEQRQEIDRLRAVPPVPPPATPREDMKD